MLGKGSSRAGGKTIRGDNMIEGKKRKENINGITTIANRFITPAGKCLNTKRAHRQGEPMRQAGTWLEHGTGNRQCEVVVPDICLVLALCVRPCHVTQHSSMSPPHPSSPVTLLILSSASPSAASR